MGGLALRCYPESKQLCIIPVGIFENLDSRVDRFYLETCWIGAPLLSQSEHNNGGLQKEIRHLTAFWGNAQYHSFSVVSS
jgi:hypothetical protein